MTTTEIIALFLTSNVVTALLTLFMNKALRKSETKRNEAQAGDLIAKMYAGLIRDLNTQNENLKRINQELEAHKEKLIRDNLELDEHRKQLLKDLKDLEGEVITLRKEVSKLNRQLEKYKKETE